MNTWQKKSPRKRKARVSAFEKAVALLGRRGYSIKEMEQKLTDKDYEKDEVKNAIERLIDYNYLNDTQFTYERIRSRATISKWGKRRIITELKNKGIAENLIEAGFMRFESGEDERLNEKFNWQEEAKELLLRKYGKWPIAINQAIENASNWQDKQQALKESQKQQAKRINFLLRRGYSSKQAIKAFESSKI